MNFIKKSLLYFLPKINLPSGDLSNVFNDSIKIYYCSKSVLSIVDYILHDRNKVYKENRYLVYNNNNRILVYISDLNNIDKIIRELKQYVPNRNIITYAKIENHINHHYRDIIPIESKYNTTIKNNNIVRIYLDNIYMKYNYLKGDLNKSKKNNIPHIDVEVSKDNYILSVKLPVPHPNCDNKGYYCTRVYKHKRFDIHNVDMIVKSIQTSYMDDTYQK